MIIKECNFEFVNLSIKEHLMFINLVFVRVMIIELRINTVFLRNKSKFIFSSNQSITINCQ